MLVFRPPSRFSFAKAARKTPIERIIDRLSPKMQREVRAAIEAARGRIDLDALARAIEQGSASRVQRLLNIDRFTDTDLADAAKTINDAFVSGAALGQSSLTMSFRFDITNPEAVRATEQRAANLLTAVNEETRATVRGIVTRAFREGRTAQQTARSIRDVIGLNERQAGALFNYQMGLIEDAVSEDRIAELSAKYSDRLTRQRAEMIARTEIHVASSSGQHELWRQAVQAGRLDPARTRRIWIANVGACDYCAGIPGLNPDGVPIDSNFKTPDGSSILGPEESHPSCRCSTGLEFA